jgi:hypothetical protein
MQEIHVFKNFFLTIVKAGPPFDIKILQGIFACIIGAGCMLFITGPSGTILSFIKMVPITLRAYYFFWKYFLNVDYICNPFTCMIWFTLLPFWMLGNLFMPMVTFCFWLLLICYSYFAGLYATVHTYKNGFSGVKDSILWSLRGVVWFDGFSNWMAFGVERSCLVCFDDDKAKEIFY